MLILEGGAHALVTVELIEQRFRVTTRSQPRGSSSRLKGIGDMRVTAKAQRSGKYWAIEVPEVAGVFTQAKRLDQVESMARAAVADLLRIAESTLEVTLEVELSAAESNLVTEVRTKLAAAESASRIASEANQRAVLDLRGDGYTSREVATILGITSGRVSQIETRAKAKTRAS